MSTKSVVSKSKLAGETSPIKVPTKKGNKNTKAKKINQTKVSVVKKRKKTVSKDDEKHPVRKIQLKKTDHKLSLEQSLEQTLQHTLRHSLHKSSDSENVIDPVIDPVVDPVVDPDIDPDVDLIVDPIIDKNTTEEVENKINTNQDSSFILKKNKRSGNFSILKKTSKPGTVQRVKYVAYNSFLPFGKEEYNDNFILNAVINDSLNLNHNFIVVMKRIIETFESLKDTDKGRYKYGINDKKFFSYMKEVPTTTPLTVPIVPASTSLTKPITVSSTININDVSKKTEIRSYQFRLYLRYGVKVTHKKHVGELSYDQLRGKRCNLDLELGSMWVNADTMMYGINIHVTHITVLN